MKKLYFAALVLSFFCSIFPQTWQVQSPQPAGVPLYDVVALSSSRVVAFGGSGKELISIDAGETWQVNSNLSTVNDINGAYFLSDNTTGWIVGNAGMIMKTIDAGDHWTSQTSGSVNQLNDIEFLNADSGVAVGASGTVLTTTNGGTTWVTRSSPTSTSAINKVCIVHNYTPVIWIGTMLSGHRIMKSTTWGASFTDLTVPATLTQGVFSMCFSDTLNYWIGSTSPGIYYTSNGGTSWYQQQSNIQFIYDLKYYSTSPIGIDASALYFTTTTPTSTNTGFVWTKTQLQSAKALRAITFNGSNIFIVGNADVILKSTDGGATFVKKQLSVDQGFIRGLVFKNNNFGLCGTQGLSGGGGIGGNLWKTTDGGANWSVLYAFGSANQIYNITMATDNIWYIGLDKNLFYKTTNAGTSFTQMTVPFGLTAQTFWSAAFLNDSVGYFGTATGNLIKTTDGGNSWTDLTAAATFTSSIYSIQVKSASEIYVVGVVTAPDRKIMKSIDGGSTFAKLDPHLTSSLNVIRFKDNNLGLVGGNGKLARTTNNGASWDSLPSPTAASIQAVAFNGSNAYLVTQSGQFASSTDNGATWGAATTINPGGFYNIAISNTNIWVSGSEGTLLKATLPSSSLTLNLTAFLEGYTNSGGTAMTSSPTVTVELHNSTAPYALVESQTGTLSTAGVGTFNFTTAVNGTSYFIVVKSWNSVETWSLTGQSFTNNLLSYNFTTAQSQAYLSNMTQIGAAGWCIYSGDVNQDGFITLADYNLVNNDSYAQVKGVVVTDLTGDEFVTLADYNIVNNNSYGQVKAHTPLLNPTTSIINPIVRRIKNISSK